ncbi:hypothetical protein [Isoptericola sp. AK164]|uniref:hypothetical protein n=1 Tax=Isoptericola sp. AK164 TaxID=3024246 RepID=UPI002418855D|nr:hypothetical protein [Isoptericola sp. AK164]
MADEGGLDQLGADLRRRVRALETSFGPYWPDYADPGDVMAVQSLANVLGLADPTEQVDVMEPTC